MRWKRIAIGSAVAVSLTAAGVFAYFQLVKAGILRYNKYDRRERGALLEGGQTPDLTLTGYDGAPVRLSSLWVAKPVVLVFGSCT